MQHQNKRHRNQTVFQNMGSKHILYSCYSFLISEMSQKTRSKILPRQSLSSAPSEQIISSRVGCGWIQNQIKSDGAGRPSANKYVSLLILFVSLEADILRETWRFGCKIKQNLTAPAVLRQTDTFCCSRLLNLP